MNSSGTIKSDLRTKILEDDQEFDRLLLICEPEFHEATHNLKIALLDYYINRIDSNKINLDNFQRTAVLIKCKYYESLLHIIESADPRGTNNG